MFQIRYLESFNFAKTFAFLNKVKQYTHTKKYFESFENGLQYFLNLKSLFTFFTQLKTEDLGTAVFN